MQILKKLFSENGSEENNNSSSDSGKPDFSNVDSLEKAKQLEKEGILEKVLLFPREFGGEDVPPNIVYVPIGIAAVKQKVTDTLVKYVQEGLITNMEVLPEYKGTSFIPSKIIMKTSSEDKPGKFNPTIDIW